MDGRRIAITAQQECELQAFSLPTDLGPGQLLIRNHFSLISPGTELGGFNAARQQAFYPGYTCVGEVAELGAPWPEALRGQTVFVFPDRNDSTGCHATHKLVAPGGLVLPVPPELAADVACFGRMLNIAATPYVLCDPKQQDTVLVLGLGLVGNFIAQVGRLRGWRVIGADFDETRRQRALRVGVDAVIDPAEAALPEAVRSLTDGRGADLTINATGYAESFLDAIAATADGGEVSTLGGARHAHQCDLRALLQPVHSRHITLRGGWELSLPRTDSPAARVSSTERNLRQAFRWLADGAVRLKPIWTHTIQPAEFPAAYAALNQRDPEYLGVIVDWR